MTVELFHYIHCPFCLRVRFALGFLNIPWKSHVLAYNDEKTPASLTGVKMLPILKTPQKTMNESLDIIDYLDTNKLLRMKEFTETEQFHELNQKLNEISGPLHSLAMPYWIYTAEFNEESRQYFQSKKEKKRGPFRELLINQQTYIAEINPLLKKIEEEINLFYHSQKLGAADILIASHLWGLYIVPEFQFSEKMHSYLQKVKEVCHFSYHEDFRSIV